MTATTVAHLAMPSIPESICRVEPFVQKIQKDYDICDELYHNILLVLTEAVNNSILHGNQSDPGKTVQVKLSKTKSQLAFEVSDEGKGFNPDNVPDPTSPERIASPNGRGVFLMKQLSEKLLFKDSGRRVVIRFKIV